MRDPILTDFEIGRAAHLLPIEELAASAGIAPEHLEPYGRYIAEVSPTAQESLADRAPAKYVVITAVTPTPLGEGKTTTSIGLA
jgi:formate--tetrahydrofolate ligase